MIVLIGTLTAGRTADSQWVDHGFDEVRFCQFVKRGGEIIATKMRVVTDKVQKFEVYCWHAYNTQIVNKLIISSKCIWFVRYVIAKMVSDKMPRTQGSIEVELDQQVRTIFYAVAAI